MALDPSYKDILGTRRFSSVENLRPGSVVQFTYDNEQRYALVLNPNWENKMHALSLVGLSPDNMKALLKEVSGLNTPDTIYDRYKSSAYTASRPYRTYTITKIKTLREIYIKEESV